MSGDVSKDAEICQLKRKLARMTEECDVPKGHRVLRQGCNVREEFPAKAALLPAAIAKRIPFAAVVATAVGLNPRWLLSLDDARDETDAQRRDFEETCLHTSLVLMTAAKFASSADVTPGR